MTGCDDGENASPPLKQAQQREPAQGIKDQGLAARAASLPESVFDGSKYNVMKNEGGTENPGLDEARFTAGIVRFYEAVLKEPIPEKMLRLLDEIGKQERKS